MDRRINAHSPIFKFETQSTQCLRPRAFIDDHFHGHSTSLSLYSISFIVPHFMFSTCLYSKTEHHHSNLLQSSKSLCATPSSLTITYTNQKRITSVSSSQCPRSSNTLATPFQTSATNAANTPTCPHLIPSLPISSSRTGTRL